MPEPGELEKRPRATILVVLAVVVVIAPLVGVYAFSPLMFVWGAEPYQDQSFDTNATVIDKLEQAGASSTTPSGPASA